MTLVNVDPARVYALMGKIDETGRARLVAEGWVYERYREGGVRPRGVVEARDGDMIEVSDCFVMSASRAAHDAYTQEMRADALARLKRWPRRGNLGFAADVPVGEGIGISVASEADLAHRP